jgi:hypothetical protein
MTIQNTAPAGAPLRPVFTFRDFEIRCVLIDDAQWLAVSVVCNLLEISNASDALSKLGSTEVSHRKLSVANRARANNFVNERGLYKLIMRSRKPEAVEFQDWVCKAMVKLDGTALRRPLRGVQGQCCGWGSDNASPLWRASPRVCGAGMVW